MINTEQKFGLDGEFKVIVRRADGSIKFATDMQPNLVLDNGIKHYLYLNMINSAGVQQTSYREGVFNHCLVGTGNKAPAATDVALQNMVAKNSSSREKTSGVEQPSDGLHEGFVKLWKRTKFIFDNINNANITEVGLATWYGNEKIGDVTYNNVYSLVTRALIKDGNGTPIAVTVLQGEVLEVIYQINMYIDVRRQTGSFKLTTTIDGEDTVDTFDYFLQPYNIESNNDISKHIYFDCEYMGVNSWGVKETDDELTADYDLNDDNYNSITHLNTNGLTSKVTTGKTSLCRYSDKYNDVYLSVNTIERSFETRSITYRNVNGIYTHNHTNGIRAYATGVSTENHYSLVKCLVVVKNRANGQGIKKTNRQLWEFNHTVTVGRWEG